MASTTDDLVELIDHVVDRLVDRMAGLDDAEWAWAPVPDDPDVTIRWRLDHIVDTLVEERTWTWLGVSAPDQPPSAPEPANASAAVRAVQDAARQFTGLLRALGDGDGEPIGPLAGPYGAATRRSFVLHIIDELVHHAAEAALLRDLHAGTRRT
jgi:hypothetical protein